MAICLSYSSHRKISPFKTIQIVRSHKGVEIKTCLVYEYILNEFSVMYCGIKVKVTNVMHCGIKVKVTIALAKFNHLPFQITSRCLFIAESEKVIAKYTSIYTVYKSIYTVLYNLVCSCGKAKLVTK